MYVYHVMTTCLFSSLVVTVCQVMPWWWSTYNFLLKISVKIILTTVKWQYCVILLIVRHDSVKWFQMDTCSLHTDNWNKVQNTSKPYSSWLNVLLQKYRLAPPLTTLSNECMQAGGCTSSTDIGFKMVLSGLLDTLQLKTKHFWHNKHTSAPSNFVPIITATR